MRWLIIAFLSVCPVFTIFSNVFTLSQYTVSSDLIELLRLNNCQLPCWLGIIPGETTLSEARSIIMNQYSDTSYYFVELITESRLIVVHTPSNYNLRIDLYTNENEVAEVPLVLGFSLQPFLELDRSVRRPTISEIQALLGEPTLVRLANGIDNYGIAMLYYDGLVSVGVEDLECDQVLPNQQVYTIGVVAQPPPEEVWPAEAQLWRGYGICYNFERRPTY